MTAITEIALLRFDPDHRDKLVSCGSGLSDSPASHAYPLDLSQRVSCVPDIPLLPASTVPLKDVFEPNTKQYSDTKGTFQRG